METTRSISGLESNQGCMTQGRRSWCVLSCAFVHAAAARHTSALSFSYSYTFARANDVILIVETGLETHKCHNEVPVSLLGPRVCFDGIICLSSSYSCLYSTFSTRGMPISTTNIIAHLSLTPCSHSMTRPPSTISSFSRSSSAPYRL